MSTGPRIFVAGHRGMVGSAIVRALRRSGHRDVVTRTRRQLDLRDPAAVRRFLQRKRPQVVYLAAARVGGILANNRYRADFISDNLAIQTAVIRGAHDAGVRSLLFLGSSCIYPRLARQPMRETDLLTGPLESTNQPYAIAKIAGIEMCDAYHRQYGRDYRAVMPTNLYGPGDNYDLETSHVIPALLRKFDEAVRRKSRQVTIWGSGRPRREFLHVDDLAEACVFLMGLPRAEWNRATGGAPFINVGCGQDLTIAQLARLIADITGFQGSLKFDRSKPDGTPRKLLDVSRLGKAGWKPRIPLREGLARTYAAFREARREK